MLRAWGTYYVSLGRSHRVKTAMVTYQACTAVRPARLFKSFFQAGFECSTHINGLRRRLDMIAATKHDLLAACDYAHLQKIGLTTIREGTRWHLIEQAPGCFDFSSLLDILRPAKEAGMEIILDLFHFGWPAHVELFSDEFVSAFANYTNALIAFLKAEALDVRFFAPMNEMSFFSWAAGDRGFAFPFACGRGKELKCILARAALEACRIIRSELPEAKLVWPEPAIHIVGSPERGDQLEAELYRRAQFEAWDMIAGRLEPSLGGSVEYLDVLGINFYERNEWVHNESVPLKRTDNRYRPLHRILDEIWHRYGRPLFISETGSEDDARVDWFQYVCSEVILAKKQGIPVHGICLYPVVNHPGWEDDRHCHNGLFDYPDPSGARAAHQPLLDALLEQRPVF